MKRRRRRHDGHHMSPRSPESPVNLGSEQEVRALKKQKHKFDRLLRKHVLSEFKMNQEIEKTIIGAREILPMTFLFERDINECRDRMKKAVVDVVVKKQLNELGFGFKKWKRFLVILQKEEEEEKRKMEEMVKKVNGFKTLNRMAKRAVQGKPRVFFRHWRMIVDNIIEQERWDAASLLQRAVRGYWGRKIASKRRREADTKRRNVIRAIFGSAFLEQKAQRLARYRMEVAEIQNRRHRGARLMQQLFRRYRAQRHVHALKTRKVRDIRRMQAAIVVQAVIRGFLKRKRVRRRTEKRRVRGIELRKLIRSREKAVTIMQRMARGMIARKKFEWMHIQWERLDQAARRVQKNWRVSKGSYAISVKVAARREKNRALVEEQRNEAATRIQCIFRQYRAKLQLEHLRNLQEMEVAKRNRSAQRIQICWWRYKGQHEMAMRCASRRYRAEREEESAVVIQASFRGYQRRKKLRMLKRKLEACCLIQRAVRCWRARRKLFRLRLARQLKLNKAATKIQCMVRARFARKRFQYLREIQAAIVIQCCCRGVKARTHLKRLQRDYQELQEQIRREREGAIAMQRVVRGFFGRQRAKMIQYIFAAEKIQTLFVRPYIARQILAFKRHRVAKHRSRVVSEIQWTLVDRTRKVKVMQRNVRRMFARKLIRRLRRERKENAACIIQRMARMKIARNAMQRAREQRAGIVIHTFWRHVRERETLKNRFIERRKLMNEQQCCALLLQRQWRARRGRARFKEMMRREKNRVMKENYVLERKRKMEAEKKRLEEIEKINEEKRKFLSHIKEKLRIEIVEKSKQKKKDVEFKPPGWSVNLPIDLDKLERVFARYYHQKSIDDAWKKVPVAQDEGQEQENGENKYYYLNEKTGFSQWETPEALQEEVEKDELEKKKLNHQATLKAKEEAKKVAVPINTLVCKTLIKWMSKYAQCNHPVTSYCHQCNQVFCDACCARQHAKGIPRNHSIFLLHELSQENHQNQVCIECKEQLVNKFCKRCNDGFCDSCWTKTHGHGVRKTHSFDEISRHEPPTLGYGDELCPSCDLAAATRKCKACNDLFCDACFDEFHEKGRRSEHQWEPANEFSVWKKLYDVNSSRYYYHNSFTNEVTWEKPQALVEKEDAMDSEGKVVKMAVKGRTRSGKVDLRSKRQRQIEKLEAELELLQKWKDDMDARQEAQEIAAKPSKFARKTMFQKIRENPATILHPFANSKTFEEEVFLEQKEYLEHMLRDNVNEKIDIDGAINGDDLTKKAYKNALLQKMAEQRKELREDMHRQAKAQLSTEEFKKRVAKCEREFRGVENSKALVAECDKAGIPYGPQHTGADKLNKQQAIEALVLHRHEKDLEKKHKLEEQKKQLKEAREARKRLAEMEQMHNLNGKKQKSRFFK